MQDVIVRRRRRWFGLLVALLTAATLVTPGGLAVATGGDFSEDADDIWMTNGVGTARQVAAVGNNLYVGGSFTAVRESSSGPDVAAPYLAAFNLVTGDHKGGFQPELNGEVRAVVGSADGSVLYVGGAFSTVGGVEQRKLAALDPNTGDLVPSFDVRVLGGGVNALALAPDGDLYVGGAFDSINGAARTRLAKVGPDGTVRPWNPQLVPANNTNGDVLALHIDPGSGRLYVGGEFVRVQGTPNSGFLTAFSLATGNTVGGFTPSPGVGVRGIDISGNRVFAAMQGPGGRAGVYNKNTGAELVLYTMDGDATGVAIVDGVAYFVGHWLNGFNGQGSPRIQGIDTSTLELDTSFAPPIGAPIQDVVYDGTALWLGGSFVNVPPVAAKGVARFRPDGYSPPPDTERPTKPSGLRSTGIGDTAVTVEWNASSDNVGVSHYQLERNGNVVDSTEALTFTHTGLQPNTEYEFRVRAVDYAGRVSVWSKLITATTLEDDTPPTAPQELVVVKRTRSAIGLEWSPATDNGGVAGYHVFRDNTKIATTTATEYTDTGLDPFVKYKYKVKAFDAAANTSAPSNAVGVRTKPIFVKIAASWRYLDSATQTPPGWRNPGFNHGAWPAGGAELGYGDGDEATVINGGQVTAYFRKRFTVTDKNEFSTVKLRLVRDDGAVVYLNGQEIARDNLPGTAITHGTRALQPIQGAAEADRQTHVAPAQALRNGTNTIAVAIHQADPDGGDLSFALKVILLP